MALLGVNFGLKEARLDADATKLAGSFVQLMTEAIGCRGVMVSQKVQDQLAGCPPH